VLLTRSGITRLIQGLEREGLVERTDCPDDARGFLVALTPEGADLVRRARATHLARVAELNNLPFTSFWASVNRIATYFSIEESDAYQLYQSAELLVRQKFQDRLRELNNRLNTAATATPDKTVGAAKVSDQAATVAK
jgi:DNA-binding MarR family transcriptional regulator